MVAQKECWSDFLHEMHSNKATGNQWQREYGAEKLLFFPMVVQIHVVP